MFTFVNPLTDDIFRNVQAVEMPRVRREIRSLHHDTQEMIMLGEQRIEEAISRQAQDGGELKIYNLNVFDLTENVDGNVMKYLAMLCVTAGFHHVRIESPGYYSQDRHEYVMYPNAISFSDRR